MCICTCIDKFRHTIYLLDYIILYYFFIFDLFDIIFYFLIFVICFDMFSYFGTWFRNEPCRHEPWDHKWCIYIHIHIHIHIKMTWVGSLRIVNNTTGPLLFRFAFLLRGSYGQEPVGLFFSLKRCTVRGQSGAKGTELAKKHSTLWLTELHIYTFIYHFHSFLISSKT